MRGSVDGFKPSVEQVAECAAQVATDLRRSKPPTLPVHTLGPWGHPPLNAAELLAAMARATVMLAEGKRGNIALRRVSLYPEAVHWSANPWLDDQHVRMLTSSHQLTALQIWTLKPAVLRKGYR